MARSKALPCAVLAVAACAAVSWVLPCGFVTPGRRAALQGAAGLVAATLGGQAALADSPSGEWRMALAKYGPPILGLKDAVEKGDTDSVLNFESKFTLLNGHWRNDPVERKKMQKLSDDILEAAAEGKADKMQEAYKKYVSVNDLQEFQKFGPGNMKHILNPASGIKGFRVGGNGL